MHPEPALETSTALPVTDTHNGKQLTTPLKSWEDLGTQGFVGPAVYHKQFTAPAVPAGKKVYLEIADVRQL